MIEKPIHIYKALTEAIEAWGRRHNIDPRAHLASVLGYGGETPSILLSNKLNYTSGTSAKFVKLSERDIIFQQLDTEDVMYVYNAELAPFGLMAVEKIDSTLDVVCFHEAVDNAMMESDDVFKVSKLALRDETLDKEELQAICKELDEADMANARLREMVKARLAELVRKANS